MNIDDQLDNQLLDVDQLLKETKFVLQKNDKPYDYEAKKYYNNMLSGWYDQVLVPLFGKQPQLTVRDVELLWNLHNEGLVVCAVQKIKTNGTLNSSVPELMDLFDNLSVTELCEMSAPVTAKMWSIIQEHIRDDISEKKYNAFFSSGDPVEWAKNKSQYAKASGSVPIPKWSSDQLRDNSEKFSAVLKFQPKL